MSFVPLQRGQKFNRLIVIRRCGTRRKLAAWECRCDCGKKHVAVGRDLRTGNTKSCGCLQQERRLAQRKTRVANHPEYETWTGMRRRCENPRHKKFYFYGGRGIRVCSRWQSFKTFLSDVGPRPSEKHSLDRFPDKNGNYEPSNCRWATQKEQCRNTRRNRIVTMGEETLCISEWCEKLGLNVYTVNGRIFRGLSPIEALTKPLRRFGLKPIGAC